MMFEKIGGVAEMPPNVRFCNLLYRKPKDHGSQQEHAHDRKREDFRRQASPRFPGGRLGYF
jgi:hypothetical protein